MQASASYHSLTVHRAIGRLPSSTLGTQHGIVTQAWSPIGGITFYRDGGSHTSTLEDPIIIGIAEAHSKSPAQVMLRWHRQQGRSAIPKSTKPNRTASPRISTSLTSS